MARIVDAEECLKRYVFHQGAESVFIHLEDDIAPWNNGSYLIGGTEVKVFKEKPGSTCTHHPKKGISLNINTLTAILFGYKRPNELFELGYIQGNSSEVDKLEHIIPYMKPFFYDFF
jgi:predicted acetyltransferase